MRAITQDRYGNADVLRPAEIPIPDPKPDEVLVRVHAAAIDRGTWHLMTGTPYLARLAIGFRRPRNRVPGRDVAGVVEKVGADVTGFAPGDKVFGTAAGSLAEFAVVPVKRLAHAPASPTFEETAALAISGLTALQAVRDGGRVEAGQRVLIIGASGGVGSYAVQIACARGAEVTAVCSGAKVEFVSSLGGDTVIDYTRHEIDGGPYDVIIDIAGNRKLKHLRRLLTPRGTLVVVGGENGGRILGGLERQVGAAMLSPLVSQRLTMQVSSENAEDMAELAAMVDAGTLRPPVDRTFPLEDAAKAIDELATGNVRGKLAITVRP